MISEFYLPVIENHWDTQFRYQIKCMMFLFESFTKIEFYQESIWEKLLTALVARKYLKGLDLLRQIYESLVAI